MTTLETQVLEWINADPSPSDRRELEALLAEAKNDADARAELADRFSGTLEFGTAGLRGAMAAGPNRMNTAVVRRAAAGLTAWLQDAVGEAPVVVVGFDARYHSADFARDTAAIVTAAGGKALLMPRPLPTPLLAYAVRKLRADAGVMVTASHNPPQDNGYKVYLGGRAVDAEGDGVQIISPVDAQIAAKIAAAPPAVEIPMAQGWEALGEQVVEDYIADTLAAFAARSGQGGAGGREDARSAGSSDSADSSNSAGSFSSARAGDLKIVYTAMHGVGRTLVEPLLERAGFTDVVPVPSQIDPDPDFPTVAFPNPEEDGALDEAIATAKEVGADLIIASDPDADRCSAAIPTADGWRQLSGDEIGAILGEQAAVAAGGSGTLASSIVSSQLLRQIAAHHGLDYQSTLTGFKWIARAAGIIYGYEEAIGFCVLPKLVKDKDGVSAALAIATTAAAAKADGRTLQDLLDDLALRHGVYHTAPVTVRVEDLSIIPATMAKVRSNPPTELVGSPVVEFLDLAEGGKSSAVGSAAPDRLGSDLGAANAQIGAVQLPPTDAVRIVTEAGDRVIIRPSGTEPKVKCYLEVSVPVRGAESLTDARAAAAARMEQFTADVNALLAL